ncbi:MAG: FtsX-like permease family protein [Mycobacteriales bacterium]
MLRATWRSLLARKLRLLLSGLAILLGVSFVSGTFVLTDTLGRVFDDLFSNATKGTAVAVRGVSALGGDQDREPVPQALLDRVRTVDGVAEAVGQVSGYAQLVGKDGKPVKPNGPPTLGVTIQIDSSQESLRVKRGTAPRTSDQVAIDATTARVGHVQVGDTVTILLKGPARKMTVTGIVGFANADSFAGASLMAFEPHTAQVLLGTPGTWTDVAVASEPGLSQTELRARIAKVLPSGFEAVTQKQVASDTSTQLKDSLSIFNTVLLAFGGIALFVGSFLIFNTFSMLVAQRVRELALMRALGASRGQVTRSVLLEALVVGLVSSLVGFGLGIAVAIGLRAFLDALGIKLPAGPTVIAPRTFVVSLVVGVGVTCAAALVPARRAARVAPVQALRESGPAEDRSLTRRTVLGGIVLAAGVVALAAGLSGAGLPLVGLGAALAFLGVTTLSPLFARPVVGLLGLPVMRLGVPSRMGRGNAMRSPRRTSATAAALMVGLALVATVSVFGDSAKKSLVKIVATSLGADYVLHTTSYQPFSPEVEKALLGKPELAHVAAFRFGVAKVAGERVNVQGVEPGPLQAVLNLKVQHGSLQSLAAGRIAVSEDVASSKGLKVSQTVPVIWSRTGSQPLVVGAVYAKNQFAGDYLVSARTYQANVTQELLSVVAVKASPSATPAQSRAVVDQAMKAFPNIDVLDQAEFIRAQGKQVDSILNVVTGLLVFSVLIAVLGIVNTLALSVVERTRELGLLRAVGLQRRQVRRMIRAESILIAIYGAVLGIAVGLCFGAALVAALHDQGITEFAVPWARLLWVLVAAALAGVVAAALPARRAARLDVLDAIAQA